MPMKIMRCNISQYKFQDATSLGQIIIFNVNKNQCNKKNKYCYHIHACQAMTLILCGIEELH